jgi:hypothetical protein
MANYFKDFWTRIKIDWYEWRAYRQTVWNVKRDQRAIERAIYRAILKNGSDGRTYYILKNIAGGFDEVNSNDLKNLRAKNVKWFPRYQDYNTMIRECFAIVTSNEITRNSYVETINNINKEANDKERQENH